VDSFWEWWKRALTPGRSRDGGREGEVWRAVLRKESSGVR